MTPLMSGHCWSSWKMRHRTAETEIEKWRAETGARNPPRKGRSGEPVSEAKFPANREKNTYATLLEGLNRHRGKGQQKVTVEHVHVHSGGRAVVGVGGRG
jgi:hypothetical protein